MTFKPQADIIIVEPLNVEEVRKSGIIIPETVEKKVHYGIVKAVGEGKRGKNRVRIPLTIKTGDKVLYDDHIGLNFHIEGVDCLGMRESDILGVMG